LVAIPTGLGKTFIAAVVMYNYYRWFPDSILIFMAPTRPLVEQQIKACYDICGLPQKDTVMMVGTSIAKAKRPQLWSSGRVFFCTPQLVDNDLTNGYCPAHKVAMVVIDEAHKATGNYAYTNVIEKLGRIQSHFRILALSATPGSTVEKVQTVVNNLRINAIEVRTEESMDVQEFSFGKRVQTVVTKLNYTEGATGVVPKTAATFCRVLFQPVLDRLHKYHAIYNPSPERCSPFLLMSDRKTYAVNAKNVPAALKRKVTVDFLLAEALSRAYEGLCVYGVGTFVDTMERFLQGMRTTLEQNKAVPFEHQKVLSHVGLRQLLDSLVQQMAAPSFVGHPKMDALLSIILRHLNEQGSASTRIMVFASIRASVNMLVQFLAQHHPMIKCAPFVGQAGDTDGMKGMTQKEQQEVSRQVA
jgi:ERCC4-related helicase